MRVLLDECVPKRLSGSWSGKKNGELLTLMAAAGFEVLLTVDQGIRHPQNLQAAGVAVIVMIGAGNQLVDLRPVVPNVVQALSQVQAGDAVEVRE